MNNTNNKMYVTTLQEKNKKNNTDKATSYTS